MFTYTLASQLQTRINATAAHAFSPAPANTGYAVNGRNQYTTVAGATFTHDLNGNLTGDGARTFGYDAENRLTSVSGSQSLTFTYDPLGRLRQAIAGTTTDFLYDGDRLIAEYNGATLLKRYAHGPGVDEPIAWYDGATLTTKRWLHPDERGSIVAWTNASAVATVYKYGAYGEPAGGDFSGSRFRYTGQIALPEVKLYHYKARVYDPMLGRFLQTDPVGYEDDFNLYAYVYNDPLNKADPTGTGKCPDGSSGCPILGTAQKTGTPGHVEAGNVDAERMAKSGDYKSVHLNQKLSTITGDPAAGGQQPDVGGVRNDTGGVDTTEHPSKTQTTASQEAKGSEMQKKLESIGKGGKHETRKISDVLKGTKMRGAGTVGAIITAGATAAAIAENPTQEGVREAGKELMIEIVCGAMGGCATAE